MKKNFIIIPLLLFSCSKSVSNTEIERVDQKDRTIDCLKADLTDCKGQAKIMADILEKKRIELLTLKNKTAINCGFILYKIVSNNFIRV